MTIAAVSRVQTVRRESGSGEFKLDVQQGGPFVGRTGGVTERGVAIDAVAALSEDRRATLGALYCAQLTALLLQRLGGPDAVVLEGPFASNPVYAQCLAALRPAQALHVSTDTVEGTARGAWMLTRSGTFRPSAPQIRRIEAGADAATLRTHHQRWLAALGHDALPEAR